MKTKNPNKDRKRMALSGVANENGELFSTASYPEQRVGLYPQLRYMGNKYRLLPWVHEVVSGLNFSTALDAFSGSGCVSYMFKSMGKAVTTNDFLRFAHELSKATVENSERKIDPSMRDALMEENPKRRRFIEETFSGIFYTPADLRFLDTVWSNIDALPTAHHHSLVLASLIRSCIKRQPRGVFTVSDPEKYKDGRRDVMISLREHFVESTEIYNNVVFDNGRKNASLCGDVFDIKGDFDLVYMDPPYVPRADDNCYVKRYHFLEGLASYWLDPKAKIMPTSKVKKIEKRKTPFSYRRSAIDAFDRMFAKFASSILVLSYSSNGYPDLDVLVSIMKKYKTDVKVEQRQHRYNFGTHDRVAEDRNVVQEYLIVGQ